MNRPLEILYNEHEIIISAVRLKDSLKIQIQDSPDSYEKNMRCLVHFIKRYADHYHHYKEETILFTAMSRKNEIFEDGIIKEMEDHHEDFREMIKQIEIHLDHKEFEQVQKQMDIYAEMLLDHIAVENEEVFLAAESLFSESELEHLDFRFQDIDRELGDAKKSALESEMEHLKKGISSSLTYHV